MKIIRDRNMIVITDTEIEVSLDREGFMEALKSYLSKDDELWEIVVDEVYDSGVWYKDGWCQEVR